MLLDILKLHCGALNSDCTCITTGETCPLYDDETSRCLLEPAPYEWDIDKLKKAFDKIATFEYL